MKKASELEEMRARLALISLLSHPDFPMAMKALQRPENRSVGAADLRQFLLDKAFPQPPIYRSPSMRSSFKARAPLGAWKLRSTAFASYRIGFLTA